MQVVHQGHHQLLHTTESDRHKIMVWIGQLGVIRVQHGRYDATLPGTAQIQQNVPMG